MRGSVSSQHSRSPVDLADELASHMFELGSFVTSRKIGSSLYPGIAAELSPIQIQALHVLGEGPLRVGALAARLGIAESTATRLVDRLESLGLTRRHEDPEDRRSVDVELTGAGRRVATAVHRVRRAILAEVLRRLEPVERGELVRLFGKMTVALAEEETRVGTARPQ